MTNFVDINYNNCRNILEKENTYMKKKITIAIICVLLFIFSVTTFAETALYTDTPYSFMPSVGKDAVCFIYNDYYKLYCNDLFDYEYDFYKNNNGLVTIDSESMISELGEDEYIYASLIFTENESTRSYYDYNVSVLNDILPQESILYVANNVPMAVVKIEYDNISNILNNDNILDVEKAFFSTQIFVQPILGSNVMGNVCGSDMKVTSADARKILRFSAGMEKIEKANAKKFYFCADMNFDGHITSADARLALRTAAHLEDTVNITFPYASDWLDFQ